MNAFDILYSICSNRCLSSYDFRYCLVDESKHPFRIDGNFAKPNCDEDFCTLPELAIMDIDDLQKYRCLGISIHASDICAIDIDHCVSYEFDVNSINEHALSIIDIFKDFAYVEFSFSGRGIRILFKANSIDNYSDFYYTKNSKIGVEYYYPEGSARYVTLTGQSIINNSISASSSESQNALMHFLDTYMRREKAFYSIDSASLAHDDRDIYELMKIVKMKYMTNNAFQNLWFSQAPGSGHDESERDYHLVAYIYENVTQDKDKIKQIFEMSPFFKSKDWKHMNKWTKNDCRYFNYLYSRIQAKENKL